MQRRQYLEAFAGTAAIVTVSASGMTREHSVDDFDSPEDVPSSELPPREDGSSVMGLTVDPIAPVGIGIIGLGSRGVSLTQELDTIPASMAEIRAICDVVDDRVEETAQSLDQDPDTYSAGVGEDEWDGDEEWRVPVHAEIDELVDDTWMDVVDRDDIDLVFVFTDLDSHAPICTYSMEQGKHVATEVSAADTIEQCWDLVDTAEETQRHCMMLEQVNYFEEELWVLNMIRRGVFGHDLSYAAGAYINPGVGGYMHSYGPPVNWRSRRHHQLKGDLYPTHGLGPLAWYMDLLRGDRPEYLIAQESRETRFSQYAQQELPFGHEFHDETDWANGDTTKSLLKTNQGNSIEIQFDVKTNRPYQLGHEVVGVDAYFDGYQQGQRSHLAVDSDGAPTLVDEETFEFYRDEYQHPLWSDDYAHVNRHGPDYLMLYRLIDALNEGRPLDQDVYDAATWSAVGPLSRISIEHGGTPVSFPDFTRGQWDEERELEVMTVEDGL